MTLRNLKQNAINCIKLRGYLNYYVEGVSSWSFSGLYFPAFGLNMENTDQKTPNTDTFHAMIDFMNINKKCKLSQVVGSKNPAPTV